MTRVRYRSAYALTAMLATLAIGFGLSQLATSELAKDLGLDVWSLPSSFDVIKQEDARCERLDEGATCLTQQIQTSRYIILELMAGHSTFGKAVEELELINRDRPAFRTVLERIHPGIPTHRLQIARWVIDVVRLQLMGEPARLSEMVAALEIDFTALALMESQTTTISVAH